MTGTAVSQNGTKVLKILIFAIVAIFLFFWSCCWCLRRILCRKRPARKRMFPRPGYILLKDNETGRKAFIKTRFVLVEDSREIETQTDDFEEQMELTETHRDPIPSSSWNLSCQPDNDNNEIYLV